MWPRRARDAGLIALAAATSVAAAQTKDTVRSGMTVAPSSTPAALTTPARPTPAPPALDDTGDQELQLEVFVNDRAAGLVVPFTFHADGTLGTAPEQLTNLGIRLPSGMAAAKIEVRLKDLPGVAFAYDDAAQTIRFTLASNAQQPAVIEGREVPKRVDPQRPPLGATVNYTLFSSATRGSSGTTFDGLSGEFGTRVFGSFGLVEHSFIARSTGDTRLLRLDTTYSYDDPSRTATFVAGDFVSSGFAWTRPVRLGGLQLRRSFDVRPDIVTVPLPSFTGTAAAPSTLDLYINDARALSNTVQQGPFRISDPPIVYGSGKAQVVLRDALGRRSVTTSLFYASPDLLAPGLTDFSVETGFARRNYGTRSNDYGRRPAASASLRRGLSEGLTMVGHVEAAGGGLALLGGGGIFTVGTLGLASLVVSGSRSPGGLGGLFDFSIESRTPHFSLLLRTQRTYGPYEDLASWTAASSPIRLPERSIFGQPREVDQASLSLPLWTGSSVGVSYVNLRRADDGRSRIGNVSFTQQFGNIGVFGNASRDFTVRGSTALFAGLSLPLGGKISASVGVSRARGGYAGYAEAAKQGAHEPGAFGWSLRATEGQRREGEAIGRYSTGFAFFEASGLYADGQENATLLMEGGVTVLGGIHASTRLDDAFAIVEVGAPGIAVSRENQAVGKTGRNGTLLVPDLAPFVSNRLSIDPAGLPIDARVDATETTAIPFGRVPVRVDLRVRTGRGSALVTLVDPQGKPIELGSGVTLEGKDQDFVVGYDGETYVDDLGTENVLLVKTPDGATCRVRFRFSAVAGEQGRIGATVCTPEP